MASGPKESFGDRPRKFSIAAANESRSQMIALFNQKYAGRVEVGYFPHPGGLKVVHYITNYKNYQLTLPRNDRRHRFR